MIDTLGLTMHFGNHLTFLAVMHQISGIEQYFPSFSDELTWVLYYKAGQYWVYGEYEGERLRLESKANVDGEITLDNFIVYICSKLYFGDVHKAASGQEDPHLKLDSPDNCRQYFDSQISIETRLFEQKLDAADNKADDSNTLDIGIHCALLDDIKGKEVDDEDTETIYVVKHPVIYIDEFSPNMRPTYYNSFQSGPGGISYNSRQPRNPSSQRITPSQYQRGPQLSSQQSRPTQNSSQGSQKGWKTIQKSSSQSKNTQSIPSKPSSAQSTTNSEVKTST